MGRAANIHILGIQGSGKGTQSALLVEAYDLLYLASGNLFRQRAAKGDELGDKIGAEMKAGRLLPDAYLYHTVIDALDEHSYASGILGDGVIRTVEQYDNLLPVWDLGNLDSPLLIHLILDEGTALERIKHRQEELAAGTSEYHKKFGGKLAHRNDDNPKAIGERFAIFHKMTEPVIARFEGSGRCVHVDATKSVEEIHQEIRSGIKKFYPNLNGTD